MGGDVEAHGVDGGSEIGDVERLPCTWVRMLSQEMRNAVVVENGKVGVTRRGEVHNEAKHQQLGT